MGHDLEGSLAKERLQEMDTYGRREMYRNMLSLLDGDRCETFNLVNHSLAMVDDIIDSNDTPLPYLTHFETLFNQSYTGAQVNGCTDAERAVVDLGKSVRRLSSRWFTDGAIGKHTYREVIDYWHLESKNLQRRWRILGKQELDELTMGIGATVASQMLFIIDPPRDPYEFLAIAKSYGRAVKLADNLCDFREDIQRGFVNVPQNEIQHLSGIRVQDGKVTGVVADELSLSTSYCSMEFERIKQAFTSADYLLLKARAGSPIWNRKLERRLHLFGQICHTWLKHAQEFMGSMLAPTNEYAL